MRVTDREYNRLRVLRALRRAEPVGRTDLAALAKLDGGTITEISRTLLQRGLILEEKVPTGKRGRPQCHLRLNPEGAYALGAYIGITGQLVCEIVNLRGDQLHLSSWPLVQMKTLEQFSESIATVIGDAIDRSGFNRASLSRIGIALPAVVDSENGLVHWVQTLDAGPYPTAALVEEKLGISVSIDNNTNVLARAEHWFGEHEELDNFSLFNLGYGLSAAHYANGALRTGRHGLNSEFGHSKIVIENGRPCGCGARGCLDAYCSIDALVRQACEATSTEMPSAARLDDALSEFVRQSQGGRPEVSDVFDRAVRYYAMAIANHINIFDPGRVIILCEHPDLLTVFSQTVPIIQANCLDAMKDLTSIELRSFEQDLFRKGAAALVLEKLYASL